MNAALLKKTARDTAALLVIVVLGILLFECLVVRALGEFAEEITELWLSHPFLTNMVKALVGADLAESVTATSLMTIGFAHPLLYALLWGFLLATCTRVITGEIDRGTGDLLLSLPISRSRVYCSVSAVWMLCGIPLCLAPLAGVWLGEKAFPMGEPLELSRLRVVLLNLLALYLTIGCGTMLVSSVLSRRGPAVGITLAILLASFLLSFLAQIWPLAERFSFLGIFDYYRPLETVRTGSWPLRQIAVLGASAAVFWSSGLWHFSRRDIPAV